MWYAWIALALVTCARGEAVAGAEGEAEVSPATTTRPPLRTLDRQAAELAWPTWLQSAESRDPNAPPRRITTKSLFITPLVCPKGQRLDRDGCVQIVTVNKDEHERYLLEQLNALFTSAPGDDELYDYGDDEPGPLQLSIPIALEPQAAPLQGQDTSSTQIQEHQPNNVEMDKKEDKPSKADVSIEAELELLKLENTHKSQNNTLPDKIIPPGHNVLNNFLSFPDKPKRDSTNINATSKENSTDEGQKELVFGNVSVDPVLYITEIQNGQLNESSEININKDSIKINLQKPTNETQFMVEEILQNNGSQNGQSNVSTIHELKNDGEKNKLNPENDYSDIGEAIKLISRYAEVTTDDNFDKSQKKYTHMNDGILGTRTKLQHRRNKLKAPEPIPIQQNTEVNLQDLSKLPHTFNPKGEIYYRYPWSGQHSPTPPPDYPFRHLQDYWPGRRHVGGVYNTGHENPRRHHHSFPHTNLRPHPYPDYVGYPPLYPGIQNYPGPPGYPSQHRLVQRRVNSSRGHANNQDLYSLLGLRHWFSSESAAKR